MNCRVVGHGLLALSFFSMIGCGPNETICTSRYGNGQLKYEVPCVDGLFDGTYREYNKHGDLWVVKHFDAGVEVDTTTYYYSGSGQLLKSVPMQEGAKHGQAFEYYEDGQLKRAQTYRQGKRHGQDINYHPDGETVQELKTYQDNVLQGPYERRDETGTLLVEGKYADGQRVGTWQHHYPSGELKATFGYEQGKKNGPFEILRPNGRPYVTGNYRRGLVSGKVIYFDQSGRVAYEETWNQGKNLDYDQASGLEQTYDRNEAGFFDAREGFRIQVEADEVNIQDEQ